MRALRPFLWAAVLVAAFVYITSIARWDVRSAFDSARRTGRLWSEPTAAASVGYSNDEQNNIDIYRASRDATVNITSVVYNMDFFFRVYPAEGSGSGFLINPSGEILTNYHVIRSGQQVSRNVTVTLADQKSYKATIKGFDQNNDLAIIHIDAGRKLPSLQLGDSDHLVVGQKVLAIGNPFRFAGTLTTGIVSSLGRTIQTEETRRLEGMIQTDAAINPGNSGGPLLDSHGNVIGINTAILGESNVGIGFAMPINRAKAMLDEFQKTGRVSRPTLGITTMYVAGDLAEALELPSRGGLLIQSVERGSAADEAGLRGPRQAVVVGGSVQLGVGGDLVMEADGQPITSNDTLPRILSRKHGGDPIDLTIYRNGRTQRVRVGLGEAPQRL